MTPTNRVLVLDTNVMQYAPAALLQVLAGRGYRLRVSIIAIEERMARSSREGVDKLRARLGNISRFIDGESPIAPLGSPFHATLGIIDGDPSRRRGDDDYNAALPGKWANLIGTGELIGWQEQASGMDTSINRLAAIVRSAVTQQGAIPKDGVTYGEVLRETRATFVKDPVVVRFGTCRLDGHISRLARILFDAPVLPTDNDVEDLALLQHLADDVILVTGDHRSIVALDETGSMQAPFVRSPWEIVEGIVPDGPPWGLTAAEALAGHIPRTLDSLQAVAAVARPKLPARPGL